MKKHTHFLGIGGIGMSALAHILLEKGESVSGDDQKKSRLIDHLTSKGALIGEHWPQNAQVVYTTAIEEDHPRLRQAKEMKIPIYHRSQLLKTLMHRKQKLLITGTHGKTSTAALLTWVLISAGFSPTYAIGGILSNTSQNGGYGRGEIFVAEADESDGSFLNYQGDCSLLTNLGKEHLDFWKEEEKLIAGFHAFADQSKHLFWCIDDPPLAKLNLKGQTYGKSKKADWQLFDVKQNQMKLFFSIAHKKHLIKEIELPLIGEHQALNACGVWALASHLGLSEGKIRAAFKTFQGVQRRLEKKGEIGGVSVYDDYAHHPTEIRAMLTALKKAISNRRLIAIFQPHRFTRTRDCFEEFKEAFDSADQVYITKIYSAGEKPIQGISAKTLSQQIPKSHLFQKLPELKSGDIVVTIGAGDITNLGPLILETLK